LPCTSSNGSDAIVSARPTTKAKVGETRRAATGRSFVRVISVSTSRSMSMLNAPAPMTMRVTPSMPRAPRHRAAASRAGAASSQVPPPTMAVITAMRGLPRAMASRTVARKG
jgi:hypothetical protein